MELPEVWGATEAEVAAHYPCDDVLTGPAESWFRAVPSVADPVTQYRWLCQLKIAPYSYDLIDNFGRRSPRTLTPGVDELTTGERMMRIFTLTGFVPDRELTTPPHRPRRAAPVRRRRDHLPRDAGQARRQAGGRRHVHCAQAEAPRLGRPRDDAQAAADAGRTGRRAGVTNPPSRTVMGGSAPRIRTFHWDVKRHPQACDREWLMTLPATESSNQSRRQGIGRLTNSRAT
jgi:hypothetical protein